MSKKRDPNIPLSQWTEHRGLRQWIEKVAELCLPDRLFFCEGTEEEYDLLAQELVEKGTLIPLDPTKRPRSFLCRTDPRDVARVEEDTYICTLTKEEAGPTNHWVCPAKMHETLQGLFKGCMRGRTMYVIPYCMGPLLSPFSRFGVEITDSAYVVLNMHWMTRMGRCALEHLGTGEFVKGVHSVGVPKTSVADPIWPCNPTQRHIVHFPQERSIWSFGSGYGGNSLLGKKCFALRIASALGKQEGWLAEHMLILGITNPEGEKKYIAAAFPSACGKTNLSMLQSTLAGWKIECVGDDIAWIHFGRDGRLYAINPEAGYFGVAPGTSRKSNPHMMEALRENVLFTNVALTLDGDVWWEGMGGEAPSRLIDWKGQPWTRSSSSLAAQPNSRFTVSARQCPVWDPEAENPQGVPLSALIFGGRRTKALPLVLESFSWEHGVFLASILSSEKTAAASGSQGEVRYDPFAMLPFCGYHMGDYFAHWLEMGKRAEPKTLPPIYLVNWFQKGETGDFLWPGFGENIRVLQWIFERTGNHCPRVQDTFLGKLPRALDLSGLCLSEEASRNLFSVDSSVWEEELQKISAHYAGFKERLPQALQRQLEHLKTRIQLLRREG